MSADEFRSSFLSFAASVSSVDSSADALAASLEAISSLSNLEDQKNEKVLTVGEQNLETNTLSRISCDDIMVETPFRVIDRAIDREEATYHALCEAVSPLRPLKRVQNQNPLDITKVLPSFGSSIPTLSELQGPMTGLIAERTASLRRRAVPASENAVSGMELLSSLAQSTYPIPLLHDQVILRVIVHDSLRHVKLGEYLVLDSQPLTALRDAIKGCVCDEADDVNWIGAQTKLPARPDGEINTPSGFFFIENTFYDDMRSKRAIRYSDTIVSWVNEKERYLQPGLFPYRQENMENVLFSDLKIRLGAHYLYQHQGHCQHTIIFTEMRMRSENDLNDSTLYPISVFRQKLTLHKCSLCKEFSSRYIVFQDKHAPTSPAFYCAVCYELLHMNENGSLVYWDYSVYKTLPLIEPIIPVDTSEFCSNPPISRSEPSDTQ